MYGISRLIIATLAIVGMIVVVLVYGAAESARMARFDANFAGRQVEAGALIFYEACASCHGANGEGLVGPALNAADLLISAEGETRPPRLLQKNWAGDLRSYLEGAITYGRPGTVMVAWGQSAGGPYRPDQVHAVASFIMNWGVDPGKKWGGAPERTALGGVTPVDVPVASLGEPPARDVRSAALGRYLFEGPLGCDTCHVFNGHGANVGPNLDDVVARMGRDYVYQSIINPNFFASAGHAPGAMPETFEFNLTDIEIESIIDYLETPAGVPSFETPAAEVETGPLGPENGQQLAQANGCVACHSIDGSVVIGPSWKGLWGSERQFEGGGSAIADADYLRNSILDPASQLVAGFQNLMPATYANTLTTAQIEDIISYIETLK
ncbi:MAG: c-type cytochrome [Caldilineales bacterium]|nr:c-type cytochrome [Caldilineales bacterium]